MGVSRSKDHENRQAVATQLHRASLRLLRRLRLADRELEISTARLSTLSVLVFIGPKTVGELASIEQVSQPIMTSLVQGLISQGLARVEPDPNDRRVRQVRPTSRGKKLLQRGQQKRVETLMAMMKSLSDRNLATTAKAASVLEGFLEKRGD